MFKKLFLFIISLSMVFAFGNSASARSGYLSDLNATYGTSFPCELCHGASKSERIGYGADAEAELGGATNVRDIVPTLIAIEGLDSDGDGYTNTEELTGGSNPSDAGSTPGAGEPVDNDGDGYDDTVDCNDNDASINPGEVEICTGAIDEDCNDAIDCLDSACASDTACEVPTPTCTDADGDGYSVEGGDCGTADCNDADVDTNPGACDVKSDGIDQDCSGKDRTRGKACPGNEPPAEDEICTDGIDNDGDGKTDCADKKDCGKDPAC